MSYALDCSEEVDQEILIGVLTVDYAAITDTKEEEAAVKASRMSPQYLSFNWVLVLRLDRRISM
jgi:hypothetical protein